MTSPYLAKIVATGHDADLHEQARRSHLAALATCCRPSTWTRALRRAASAVTRLRTRTPGSDSAVPCCGTA